jgi:hypothetical protein
VPTFKAYSKGAVVQEFTGAARTSLEEMVGVLSK